MENMAWVFRYDSPNEFTDLGRPEIRLKLKELGIKTNIDEFEKNLRNKYFCPGCGGKATRSPLEKDVSRDGKKAYFKHEQNQASSDCPLYVKSRPGNQYLSEKESDRFADHDSLVVCPKWSERGKGIDDGDGDRTYDGITEDDWGEKLNSPIGRHYGKKVGTPNRITSVRKIAHDFDGFIMKSIAFPGDDKSRMVRDILFNLNENELPTDHTPRLYYGEIIDCGHLSYRGYIHVKTLYSQIELYVWNDDFDSRNIIKGRSILFYTAMHGTDVKIDNLGQFDLIPVNQEKKFDL